jgi:anti-sigma factor RsiW
MDCLTHSHNGAQTLLDYCSGALEPAAAAEVTRHVESCDDCRRVVNAQREVWETLGQWTAPAVSEDFNTRLYARIGQENQDPGWRQWIRRMTRPALPCALWKPAALAAGCAVLVVGFLVHEPRVADNGPQIETQQHVDIEQVANALEELDLLTPSGSSSAM